KRAPLVMVFMVCIYVGTLGLFSAKPSGFIPNEDAGVFIMGASLPEGSSTARTQEFVDRVTETVREKNPEVSGVTSITGINILNSSFRSNAATFFVQLKPWKERERGIVDIIAGVS